MKPNRNYGLAVPEQASGAEFWALNEQLGKRSAPETTRNPFAMAWTE